jgi:hypothetical protein
MRCAHGCRPAAGSVPDAAHRRGARATGRPGGTPSDHRDRDRNWRVHGCAASGAVARDRYDDAARLGATPPALLGDESRPHSRTDRVGSTTCVATRRELDGSGKGSSARRPLVAHCDSQRTFVRPESSNLSIGTPLRRRGSRFRPRARGVLRPECPRTTPSLGVGERSTHHRSDPYPSARGRRRWPFLAPTASARVDVGGSGTIARDAARRACLACAGPSDKPASESLP